MTKCKICKNTLWYDGTERCVCCDGTTFIGPLRCCKCQSGRVPVRKACPICNPHGGMADKQIVIR